MWKEQKGRTSTDGKSQSAGDQGNGAVIHVEMWEERQDSTTDEGQRERMTETKHHVMMWEGRHTPKNIEQEANLGRQLQLDYPSVNYKLGPRWDDVIPWSDFKSETSFGFLGPNYTGQCT